MLGSRHAEGIANATAAQAGYTVIPGGALSSDAWANVRKHGILTASAKVFPTPKPEDVQRRNEIAGACPTCMRPF